MSWKDTSTDIHDIMNPPAMFVDGKRMRDLSIKDLPPFSAKLMPEFDKRRSIKDMFKRHAAIGSQALFSQPTAGSDELQPASIAENSTKVTASRWPFKDQTQSQASTAVKRKNSTPAVNVPVNKKSKIASLTSSSSNLQRGQRTLQGFFQKKSLAPLAQTANDGIRTQRAETPVNGSVTSSPASTTPLNRRTPSASSPPNVEPKPFVSPTKGEDETDFPDVQDKSRRLSSASDVHDPIVAKEGWTKLFTKKQPPRCEDHDEPCTLFQTKKKGFNNGRSFWICARYVMPPDSSIPQSFPLHSPPSLAIVMLVVKL